MRKLINAIELKAQKKKGKKKTIIRGAEIRKVISSFLIHFFLQQQYKIYNLTEMKKNKFAHNSCFFVFQIAKKIICFRISFVC